ncbi:MAG: GNAT family N-acetyltransferase [Cyclobacteriaceae bacterium]|jgi:hypothetical protein|nr:GNAT family N-acetyltransferase [Cyclobacteriaceae bacterium]
MAKHIQVAEKNLGFQPELLYNFSEHIALGGNYKTISLHYLNKEKKVIANWTLPILPDLKIPLHAPFAVPETRQLSAKEKANFIVAGLGILKQHQVEKVEITLPPEGYKQYKPTLIAEILKGEGFSLLKCVNHFLIDVNPDKKFEESITSIHARKLKKAKQTGLAFKVGNAEALKEIYDFIFNQRTLKQYKLSLSYIKIKKLQQTFKTKVKLFSVYHNKEMVAACIGLIPDSNTFYTLYYDHHIDYNFCSPNVFLLNEIYKWCIAQNLQLLDLGSAHINDKPNLGLQDFKLNAGAYPSAKLTLSKEL